MSAVSINKGDDRVLSATVTDENDALVNLTGALGATFSIRTTLTGTPVLQLTLGSGVTIPTPTNGVIVVTLSAAQTGALYGSYWFDLVLLDAASKTTTVDAGTLLVRPLGEVLLTVDQLRLHVTSTLGDAALQRLLDAAEQAIWSFAGPPDSAVQYIDGGHQRLALARRATSITSITETPRGSTTTTTLAANDYRLRAEGYVIERLNTGTNARSWFSGLITVTYSLASNEALRELVQIELVKLDISLDTNLRSHTIGDFSETFAADRSPDEQRLDILSRLAPEPGMMVVGG